ncbi:MAG: TetR/AcrR family transcriptional regulator [Epsilonproteobacteria bacterium]|nr:TetR/AcrR family transcriptional regulator [Campylobacterota bacterium]
MSNIRSNTYKKIINSAIALFRKKGYQEVSILSICKDAGIGNSTFYQYFPTKDALLKEIVENLIELIGDSVSRSMNHYSSIKVEKLQTFLKDFFDCIYDNIDRYAVFRNAEFLNPDISIEFYEKIYKIFENSLFSQVENEICKKAVFIFVMGSARFVIAEYGIYKGIKPSDDIINTIADLLHNGLDPDNHTISQDVFSVIDSVEPAQRLLSKGSMTHQKLLDAAEYLFGKKGYSKTKISDIAYRADVGLGTFYIHFDSKIEALRELVARTFDGLKSNVRRYISRFEDRRDAEIAGYIGFCDFFKRHKNMYAIVRETEFIEPETADFYYSGISKSYMRPLKRAFERNEYRRLDPKPLSYALIGIGDLLGQYLLVRQDSEMSKCIEYMKHISRLLMCGLNGFVEKDELRSSQCGNFR